MTDIETVEKKKRVNSKKKGSSFELQIAKKLSEVLAPMNFKRTQQSGAITGGKNARFNHLFSQEALSIFVGDLFPTNEIDVARDEGWKFKFTLECKFYKDCDNLEHLFHNTKVKGWMEQAITDSKKLGKKPLLIFKFNRTETYCAVQKKFFQSPREIIPKTVSRFITIKFPPDEFSKNEYLKDGLEMVVFLFKEALEDLSWWKTEENPAPLVEEQPPSGTLCDPDVAKAAFKAVFYDIQE